MSSTSKAEDNKEHPRNTYCRYKINMCRFYCGREWANADEATMNTSRLLHDDIGFCFPTILSQLLSHFRVVYIDSIALMRCPGWSCEGFGSSSPLGPWDVTVDARTGAIVVLKPVALRFKGNTMNYLTQACCTIAAK